MHYNGVRGDRRIKRFVSGYVDQLSIVCHYLSNPPGHRSPVTMKPMELLDLTSDAAADAAPAPGPAPASAPPSS